MTGSLPDLINGVFELLGGFFVFWNCVRVYKDKDVKGVSIWVTAFFSSWGFWNIYYYPHLDQWLSFAGGLAIVSANTIWVIMMVYYTQFYSMESNWRE